MDAPEMPSQVPQDGITFDSVVLHRRQAELVQRLEALTAAIAAAPDDPINYVLRGQVRLMLNHREEAAEDFRRGLLLIAAVGETDWGYIHTALAERAQAGLRECTTA